VSFKLINETVKTVQDCRSRVTYLIVSYVQKYRFDLLSLDSSGPEDEEGIRKAANMVHSLIAEEVAAGISTKRIILGGFSQGGALAMYSGLTFPEPLAGIIALSAWLPLHKKFPIVSMPRAHVIFEYRVVQSCHFQEAIGNKDTPLLQCHGDCDPMVPYRWGQMTASLLKQFMTQTEFKTYRGMMHTSCEEVRELVDPKRRSLTRERDYGLSSCSFLSLSL
jgi:lysophospholipase-2